MHWATGRWPPTHDHVRTACSRFTGIEARLLQGRWCTWPPAAGHLRTTTYGRPVPDSPEYKPGSCKAAGAQGHWLWPPTYDHVRTACSRFTGIQARLLQGRWCTEPLAAGHHVRPRTNGLFQIHRTRGQVLQGCGAQGRWPLATYVRPRADDLFQIHRNRSQALAGLWCTGPLAVAPAYGHPRRASLGTRPTDDSPQAARACLAAVGSLAVQGRWTLPASCINGHQAYRRRSATPATLHWPPGFVEATRLTYGAPLATRLSGGEAPHRQTLDWPKALWIRGDTPHKRRSTGLRAQWRRGALHVTLRTMFFSDWPSDGTGIGDVSEAPLNRGSKIIIFYIVTESEL